MQAKSRLKMTPYKASSIDSVTYYKEKLEKNKNPYRIIIETAMESCICMNCKKINAKVLIRFQT